MSDTAGRNGGEASSTLPLQYEHWLKIYGIAAENQIEFKRKIEQYMDEFSKNGAYLSSLVAKLSRLRVELRLQGVELPDTVSSEPVRLDRAL